jgi:hypothetical protein
VRAGRAHVNPHPTVHHRIIADEARYLSRGLRVSLLGILVFFGAPQQVEGDSTLTGRLDEALQRLESLRVQERGMDDDPPQRPLDKRSEALTLL